VIIMILNFAVSFSFPVDCLGKSEPVLFSLLFAFFFSLTLLLVVVTIIIL
jgi:hypothetical protein